MGNGIDTGLFTGEAFGHFVYWTVLRHPRIEFSDDELDAMIRKEFPRHEEDHGGTGAYQPIPRHRSYAKNQRHRLGIHDEAQAQEVLARIDGKMNPVKEQATAFILCWNPTRWDWDGYDKVVRRSSKGTTIQERWSTGNNKTMPEGHRVFLYRQAIDRGIIASGWTTSGVYLDDHWDGSGKQHPYVNVAFDRMLSVGDVLPVEALSKRFPEVNWNRIQASGVSLPAAIGPRLERLWEEHLSQIGMVIDPQELAVPGLYVEGAVRSVTVNAYERNPQARQACVDHYGFDCAVCGFNFANAYGTIGEGFIHVHHLADIAKVGHEYQVDPVKDLRPVCPNCHAMLHTSKPSMSIAKLKTLLKQYTNG